MMVNTTEYEYVHEDNNKIVLIIPSNSKYESAQKLRKLVQDPDKWVLSEIRQVSFSWLPIRVIESEWKALQPKTVDETKKRSI